MAKKNKTTDNLAPESDDHVENVMDESGIEDLAGEEKAILEDDPARSSIRDSSITFSTWKM